MNKRQIQLSAKNLGALALSSFCPRCFWNRMYCGDKVPYQIFPGIFSSIDSYSKKVTSAHFRQYGRVPRWFDGFGDLGGPIRVPGWSKFQVLDEETNILLTGVPDEILRHPERGISILDYKTARFTDTQDTLSPMYEIQLNCYAVIASRIGLGPVFALGLLYYEPVTDLPHPNNDSLITEDGFFLKFSPKLRPIELRPEIIRPLLRRVRKICDCSDCPPRREDCRDCSILETLLHGTSTTGSWCLKNCPDVLSTG